VLTVCVDGLQQVAPQVPVAAGKQPAQAGHDALDELVTRQHPAVLMQAAAGAATAAAATEEVPASQMKHDSSWLRLGTTRLIFSSDSILLQQCKQQQQQECQLVEQKATKTPA
jgi:hypothetical protein